MKLSVYNLSTLFERETQSLGQPRDMALVEAFMASSWLLLTVNQGVTFMTHVIH